MNIQAGSVTFDYTAYNSEDEPEVLEISCDYSVIHNPEMFDEPETFEVECTKFKAMDFDRSEIWDVLDPGDRASIRDQAEEEAIADTKG
jgi:hypothetical protein